MKPEISIIIPTNNEMKNGYLESILENLKQLKNTEIICVDSESTDGTRELIKKYDVTLIDHKTYSRGERLTIGAQKAQSEFVFFHHPRTLYDKAGFDFLMENKNILKWGGFTQSFDKNHFLLKFTSWYSNKIRADKKSIFYLDHGVFIQKKLLEKINYVPNVDVFEDTLLSIALKKHCPGVRLDFLATTSAIRFENNGVLKQILLNMLMKIYFYLKIDHRRMNKIYEKKNRLNAKYERVLGSKE